MSGNPQIPFAARDLLFIDCETSGLDPKVHEILEWASVLMSADLQTERARIHVRCALQWPERAEARALEVNGYTAHAWRHAVSIRVLLVDFRRFLSPDVFVVGHNPEFDWSMLREAYAREALAMPETKYKIDTASMAWPLVVSGHLHRVGLDAICSKYGISNVGAHIALADVFRTVRAYGKMLGLREPRFGPGIDVAGTVGPEGMIEIAKSVPGSSTAISSRPTSSSPPKEEEVPEWARF